MKKINKPIIIVLVFALILRVLSWNQSFWLDEGIAAETAINFSIKEYFNGFLLGDFHPPLYFIIQKLFYFVLGSDEYVFRLPALISGVITVLVTYLISKEVIKNKTFQLWPSILVTTSPILITYSFEARPYSLTGLIVILNLYFLLLTKKKFSRKYCTLFFITNILIIYLNYIAYLYVFSSSIYMGYILWKNKNKNFTYIFSISIIFVIISSLMFPIFMTQLVSGSNISSSFSGWQNVIGSNNFLKNFTQFFIKTSTGLVDFSYSVHISIVALLNTAVYLLAIVYSLAKRQFNPVLIVFLSTFMFVMAIAVFLPIYSYFRLLFLIPFIYIVIINLNVSPQIIKKGFYFILVSNFIFILLYFANPIFWREDWKGAKVYSDFLSSKYPNAMTVFSTKVPYDIYYYYNTSKAVGAGDEFIMNKIPTEKQQILLKYDQIIYYSYLSDLTDPSLITENFLKTYYSEITGYSFNKIGSVKIFIKK